MAQITSPCFELCVYVRRLGRGGQFPVPISMRLWSWRPLDARAWCLPGPLAAYIALSIDGFNVLQLPIGVPKRYGTLWPRDTFVCRPHRVRTPFCYN